jgi:hypothetical protein
VASPARRQDGGASAEYATMELRTGEHIRRRGTEDCELVIKAWGSGDWGGSVLTSQGEVFWHSTSAGALQARLDPNCLLGKPRRDGCLVSPVDPVQTCSILSGTNQSLRGDHAVT